MSGRIQGEPLYRRPGARRDGVRDRRTGSAIDNQYT